MSNVPEVTTIYDPKTRKLTAMQNGLKHGKELTFDEKMNIISEHNYIADKKHGLHKLWESDGKLGFLCNYTNDLEHGDEFMFENNILVTKRTFVNGEEHGIDTIYNDHGDLSETTTYVHGKKHGPQVIYNDGIYGKTRTWIDNQLEEIKVTVCSQSGIVTSTRYRDGKKNGIEERTKLTDDTYLHHIYYANDIKHGIEFISDRPKWFYCYWNNGVKHGTERIDDGENNTQMIWYIKGKIQRSESCKTNDEEAVEKLYEIK